MADDAVAPAVGAEPMAGLPEPIAAVLRQLGVIAASASPSADPLRAWALSGAMWLSGPAQGPPVAAPGGPALLVETALGLLAVDRRTPLPGTELLSERAALLGLHRQGSRSCGGAAHLLPSLDQHVAISLARADDAELLPALISAEVGPQPLAQLTSWVAATPAREVVDRAQLLGLSAAVVLDPHAAPDVQAAARGGRAGAMPVVATGGGERRAVSERPLVVDLSSLWAGPLCAHLLGLLGADVVKVESPARLDGARNGSAEFYDLLHGGHESVTVDLRSPEGVSRLRGILDRADVVIEASRPRALAQLGIDATEFVERGTTWVSITAYGRTGPWSNRVGFGDDVAVAGGMVGWAGRNPCFLGDALADPMTGVVAALLTWASLGSGRGHLLDVSMRDVVASTLGPIPAHEVAPNGRGGWRVVTADGEYDLSRPRPRRATHPAAPPGAHNEKWFGR